MLGESDHEGCGFGRPVPLDASIGAEFVARPIRNAPFIVGVGLGVHRAFGDDLAGHGTESANFTIELGRSAVGRAGWSAAIRATRFFTSYEGTRWMVNPGLTYTF
ncbi:MAG: hypothetical protein HOP28_04555 [Gemmatimonadales bacterium]|nr:hypothetical protein [Gemmatimonadales bacterium]